MGTVRKLFKINNFIVPVKPREEYINGNDEVIENKQNYRSREVCFPGGNDGVWER